MKFFTEQDIVGETMATWLEMKNLENRTDYIISHAKKERKPLLDLVTFERVKRVKYTKLALSIFSYLPRTEK